MKTIIGLLLFVIIGVVALPPVLLGTKAYPVTIVDGSSMYPTLHNGDVVLYQGMGGMVPNGTIIVAIPGETGLSLTDQIVAPTVIHRVVGTVIQADGTVYYKTKGDNNAQADPWLTRSDHVLGTPVAVVPYVGAVVNFVKSTQGLVMVLGALMFFYLSRLEDKVESKEEKDNLVAALAEMSLNGEISRRDFDKLELAIEHSDRVNLEKIKDEQVVGILDWIKAVKGRRDWKLKKTTCPRCGSEATAFEEGDNMFVLCRCQTRTSKGGAPLELE